MFSGRDSEITEILESSGYLTSEQTHSFVKQAFEQSRNVCECMLSAHAIDKVDLLTAVASSLEYSLMDRFEGARFTQQQLEDCLPRKTAVTYGVLVLGEDEEGLHLVAVDPFDHHIEMDLGHYFQKPLILYVGDPDWVESEIGRCYPAEEVDQAIGSQDASQSVNHNSLDSSATLIDYVDALMHKSIQDGASDIHFEPFEHCFRIRYRVDGNLQEIPSQANHLGTAIISRIKVMARLNITETRIPQDGRIQIHAMGRTVDVRVSTLPTQFGESVVLRILDKTQVNLDLDMLGMPDDLLSSLRRSIHAPNGIFLATGPTGSGKTTTLYSALRELNQPGSKLLTVEDPVEYDIEGIMQIQTHALIGLDFSKTLRAFLRHDPDKILIGEIRDAETARIAVQASLTGHMVFSSLHTNDASGAITRFVDMGVEPYLVAASLVAVMAQRLLRRLDPDQCERYVPDDYELKQLAVSRKEIAGGEFARPVGSDPGRSAYRGRVGLYELITVDDGFREAISARKSHSELSRLAKSNGMLSLRKDGLRALLAGKTSVAEVLRYT